MKKHNLRKSGEKARRLNAALCILLTSVLLPNRVSNFFWTFQFPSAPIKSSFGNESSENAHVIIMKKSLTLLGKVLKSRLEIRSKPHMHPISLGLLTQLATLNFNP